MSALISARDGDARLSEQELLSTHLPVDRRRTRHDDQPDREQRRRAPAPSRAARRAALRPVEDPRRGRGAPPLRRSRPARDVPVRGRARRDRRRHHPGGCAGHHQHGVGEPRRRPLRAPRDARHRPCRRTSPAFGHARGAGSSPSSPTDVSIRPTLVEHQQDRVAPPTATAGRSTSTSRCRASNHSVKCERKVSRQSARSSTP